MKLKYIFMAVIFILNIHAINILSQTNLIQNGDFEQDWTYWVSTGSVYANDNFPTRAHSGTHYAYLSNPDGTPGNNLQGGFGQTVFIPADASSAELKFYYSINTSETGTTVNDAFQLFLNNIGTEVFISNVGQLPIGGAVLYKEITYPLLDYKGSNVSISIVAVTNNNDYPTVFRFDDFSVSIVTDVASENDEMPADFKLKQNYPNPFNPSTTISYSIPKTDFVTLKVFDLLGNEIATLVDEEKSSGNYKVEFDGSNLPSGVYFYILQSGEFSDTKKFILIK